MAEITICEALKELKTLDARIIKQTNAAVFTTVETGSKLPAQFKSKEAFTKDAPAALASIKDLIARRNAIKSAIVESNARTEVTIGGEKYTVAAAIERKGSIKYEQALVRAMGMQLLKTLREIEAQNDQMKRNLDMHISTILGKDAAKNGGKEVDDITNSYTAKNEAKIVDPCNLKDEIDRLEKSIEDFLANVDTQLSISNATTKVDVG